jgi:hypothetical protein
LFPRGGRSWRRRVKVEAERIADEARELVGEVPF